MADILELKFNEENKLTLEGRVINAVPVGVPFTLSAIAMDADFDAEREFNGQALRYCPKNANAYVLGMGPETTNEHRLDITNSMDDSVILKAVQYYRIV